MSGIDQFESVFKSAARTPFRYEAIDFQRGLIVTDLEDPAPFGDRVREFLGRLDAVEWTVLPGSRFQTVGELLDLVNEAKPDLICSYRNLHSSAWKWPHSLGSHLDVLTQVTSVPVLVLPHPEAGRALEHSIHDTNSVMAITNHLVGDHRLVNIAAHLTVKGGTLWLSHIEDRHTFEHFVDAVSKIPEIDTDVARERVGLKLMQEPKDYIASCRTALEKKKMPIRIEEIVTMGRRLEEYRKLIESHEVDLLVMHTKDEDQLAMHGIAYPLAVELREIPLLLI